MHWSRSLKPQVWALVYIIASRLWVPTNCIVEGISMYPKSKHGFQLSEISVPQFLLLILVFLELVLLYTLGILPVEYDFSSNFAKKGLDASLKNDTSSASVASPNRVLKVENTADTVVLEQINRYDYIMLLIILVVWAAESIPFDFFSQSRRKRDLLPENHLLRSVMWDCPLQFVCEVDHWANRDHEFLIESMIAKWLRNPSNHTFHSTQGQVFGGLPETCPAMYPCPFDVQKAVGITIPGSARAVRNDVDHSDPDSYLSLF
ncbi:uncharacterized protein LOC108681512 isoform X1 [Hyalella azteca]|uniref:Uncharacterized protein LOC108681512 isoform X1 n=1 Tax=Hyalella azteca TaxID=294128 RepID=A0A8B7PJ77_HYAAZ|nr:uncharacterized protein LOC108681512 isoform X1 [Hyalella azteca]